MKTTFLFATLTKFLIVVTLVSHFTLSNAQTLKKPFDVNLFQKELSTQMKVMFPYMNLDTTLNHVLYASSQAAAGYPNCYGTHHGNYINASGSETEAAVKAVQEYNQFLINRIFLKESAIKGCGFVKYCCIALNESGLVHYELVIDNERAIDEMSMDRDYY